MVRSGLVHVHLRKVHGQYAQLDRARDAAAAAVLYDHDQAGGVRVGPVVDGIHVFVVGVARVGRGAPAARSPGTDGR